jgi:hypothetical protein
MIMLAPSSAEADRVFWFVAQFTGGCNLKGRERRYAFSKIGTRSSGGVAGLVTLIAASGAIDREA